MQPQLTQNRPFWALFLYVFVFFLPPNRSFWHRFALRNHMQPSVLNTSFFNPKKPFFFVGLLFFLPFSAFALQTLADFWGLWFFCPPKTPLFFFIFFFVFFLYFFCTFFIFFFVFFLYIFLYIFFVFFFVYFFVFFCLFFPPQSRRRLPSLAIFPPPPLQEQSPFSGCFPPKTRPVVREQGLQHHTKYTPFFSLFFFAIFRFIFGFKC